MGSGAGASGGGLGGLGRRVTAKEMVDCHTEVVSQPGEHASTRLLLVLFVAPDGPLGQINGKSDLRQGLFTTLAQRPQARTKRHSVHSGNE